MAAPDSWQDALRNLLPDDYQPSTSADAPKADSHADKPSKKPVLVVSMERRNGKPSTFVSGFAPDDPAITTLAAQLKRKLATGGSARGGEILIQGDRRAEVAEILRSQGYKVKGA